VSYIHASNWPVGFLTYRDTVSVAIADPLVVLLHHFVYERKLPPISAYIYLSKTPEELRGAYMAVLRRGEKEAV